MPPERNEAAGRLGGLDVIRGLAALSVALFHFTFWNRVLHAPHVPLDVSLAHGFLGVDLFFVLSGFIILLTIERSAGLRSFAIARSLRLWPTFVACCLLTAGLFWAVRGTAPDLLQLAANLSMIPIFFQQVPIDGSYWTLGCEVDFYALAGFGILVLRLKPEVFCLAWLAAAAGCLILGSGFVPGRVRFILQPEFAPLFVIGMMSYRIFQGRLSMLGGVVGVLALGTLALGNPHWGHLLPVGGPAYAALISAMSGCVVLGARCRLDPARRFWRPLVWCGRVSYPFYLVHQGAGYLILAELDRRGVDPYVAVAVALVSMFACAELVTRGVAAATRLVIGRRRSVGRRSVAVPRAFA